MAISKNVTIQQIAEKANISIATASRVIKQSGGVKPETRSKVLNAMKELDFQAKGNEHKMILASFPDFSNPFYSECIRGIQAAANKKGYQLFLQQMENHDTADAYKFLFSNQIFSGIIFAHTVPDSETLESLRMQYPIVMCSEYNDTENIPYVVIDDYAAASNAMRYLLSIGKKRIAMINSTLDHSYAVHRERGYKDALHEAGLPVNKNWITHISSIDYDMAYSTAASILSGEEFPDAVFCVSDVFASAVIKAAHNLNRPVPEKVAVMGFDNVSLTTMTVPTITSVSQPTYQIGWQSCNLLIDQLEGTPVFNKHVVLGTEIIVRGST